jgi:hypothetical protein
MSKMSYVYFADADAVVHKVHSDLTHFEPNDESSPYVLDKLTINFVSGMTHEQKIDKFYFQVINDYFDETSPTFDTYTSDTEGKAVFVADFVRFIGSRKLVRVIVNYWIYGTFQGRIDDMYMNFLPSMVGRPHNIEANFWTIFVKSLVNDPQRMWDHEMYSKTITFIVDVCEYIRDIVDYVKASTNELYAKRLDGLLAQIDKLLADLNPTKHMITMKWLMNDFEFIPRRIRDAWLSSE